MSKNIKIKGFLKNFTESLLGNSSNLSSQDDNENNIDRLVSAASKGEEENFNKLLEKKNIDINALGAPTAGHNYLCTALIAATSGYSDEERRYNCEKIAKKILNHPNIDINAKDTQQETAFTWALIHGNLDIAELLIKRKELKAEGKHLINAAGMGFSKIAEMLLCRPEISTDDRNQALLMAARVGSKDEVIKILLQDPLVNINHKDENGKTALIWASMMNNHKELKILINQPGIIINNKDKEGFSAFELAAKGGRSAGLSILLYQPYEYDEKELAGAIELARKAEHGEALILLTEYQEMARQLTPYFSEKSKDSLSVIKREQLEKGGQKALNMNLGLCRQYLKLGLITNVHHKFKDGNGLTFAMQAIINFINNPSFRSGEMVELIISHPSFLPGLEIQDGTDKTTTQYLRELQTKILGTMLLVDGCTRKWHYNKEYTTQDLANLTAFEYILGIPSKTGTNLSSAVAYALSDRSKVVVSK